MLAACAPRIAGLGEAVRTPAIEGDRFVTRDGLALGLQKWEAEHPAAVVVALHGMSDYANAFAMPGAWWAQHGISTYAYDQRGFGRSPHPGIWPGGAALRRDLADFVGAVRARHPGAPLYVLGESMGGAVVLTALAEGPALDADGVILAAPAVWGWSSQPLHHRVALWLSAHTIPWFEVRPPRGLKITPSDNIEMLRALARDPLFRKDTRTDAVYGLVTLMDEAARAPARIATPPILLVYGAKDEIIPKEPAGALASALADRACIRRYDGGYHMLLRDLQAEKVWADIAAWMNTPGHPCP